MARTRRPRRRRDQVGWRLAFALALSLLVNGALLWVAMVTGAFSIGSGAKVVSPVSLSALSAADWERNRAARPVPPPVPKAPPPPDERGGQVVELPPVPPPGAKEERPDDARFLAERNQKVEKETVSKYAQGHAGQVLPTPQQGSPGEVKPKPPAPQPAPAPGPKVASAERPRGAQPGDGPSEWRTGEQGDPKGIDGLAARLERSGEGGPPGATRKLDLSVTPETIARIGGGPNMDGFREAEQGELTALNTREFKFATYMNQIRRRIGEAWYPRVDEVVRARDPDGKAFFYKERAVTLAVVLDTTGRVSDVQVTRSSNIDFFDRLAINSVRQAQPFLNPPPGLFDPDGYARIPFGFVLYPSQGAGSVFWRPPTGE